MLRPTKHSHPDRTVLGLAAFLLARLKKVRIEDYGALRGLAGKRIPGAEVIFLPAISLLYLLGLVEYRPKRDAFEYVGR